MPQAVSGETLVQCLSHLTPNERAGLAAFIHRLHQDYGAHLLRVILFGSKARGDFDDQSDLDVLVVVHMSGEDYWQHWRRIVAMAWEVELAYSLVISSIIKMSMTIQSCASSDHFSPAISSGMGLSCGRYHQTPVHHSPSSQGHRRSGNRP
jgi:predicted nucleotidyltransferase